MNHIAYRNDLEVMKVKHVHVRIQFVAYQSYYKHR